MSSSSKTKKDRPFTNRDSENKEIEILSVKKRREQRTMAVSQFVSFTDTYNLGVRHQ